MTYEGPTPPLTSTQTATFDDIAQIGAEITGHDVKRTVIPDEVFVEQMTSHGAPQVVAEQVLGIFKAARADEFKLTDPTLEKLLGRPTQTMRDVVEEKFGT